MWSCLRLASQGPGLGEAWEGCFLLLLALGHSSHGRGRGKGGHVCGVEVISGQDSDTPPPATHTTQGV